MILFIFSSSLSYLNIHTWSNLESTYPVSSITQSIEVRYVVVLAHIRYQLLLVTSTKNKSQNLTSDNLDHDVDRRKLKPSIQFCRVYVGLNHHHCCVKAWNHIGIIGKAPQMWQNGVIEFKQPLQSGQEITHR